MKVDNNRLSVFSGSSNPELAREICEHLDIPLGRSTIKQFSDGETFVKLEENVRGNDVFIIQSTSKPANDHIMELALMIDACKRASAQRINAVIPYYGYGRQDRKAEPRVPISAKTVADILEKLGIQRVISMDLHADQIQGFFNIPVDHLFAAKIFVDFIAEKLSDNAVIVSPDSGGAERARFFAKQLHAGLAIIDKRRPKANVAEVMNIIGDVEGKDCIVLDDMIDTAGTITKAAKAIKDAGAASVRAVATHGVLSGPAIERLKDSAFSEIYLSNTIRLPPEKRIDKIQTLSVASLIARAIKRVHNEESVSTLFLE